MSNRFDKFIDSTVNTKLVNPFDDEKPKFYSIFTMMFYSKIRLEL